MPLLRHAYTPQQLAAAAASHTPYAVAIDAAA